VSEINEAEPTDDGTPVAPRRKKKPYTALTAAEQALKDYNSNDKVIRQALRMVEDTERIRRTVHTTFTSSPMAETVRALHESRTQLTQLMDSPVLQAARDLQQQSSILETGRALAAVNAQTADTIKSITEVTPAAKILIAPPPAITTLATIKPILPGSGELDALTRTHRDLTRTLTGMSDSWHKGLLDTPWAKNGQMFTLPQLPRGFDPRDILGGIDWTAMQAASRTTAELHRLLRSWQHTFQTTTDSVLAFLARSGYMAALRARNAVLHGDHEAVAEFIENWLHLKPTPWRIEAVSAALLEEGWEIEPADALTTIRIRTTDQHHVLRPVWETQLNGRKVGMLDQPIGTTSLTLGDLATDRSTEDVVLEASMHHAIEVMMGKLNPDEREVAQVYMFGNVDWLQAAEEAGQPRKFGRRVNRKLQRLGNEYTRRHGDIEL
jgi:hypothetical protein